MPQSDNIYYYLFYALIVVVFIVVLKMPKKTKGNTTKNRPVSTSKKFKKNVDNTQNTTKDV